MFNSFFKQPKIRNEATTDGEDVLLFVDSTPIFYHYLPLQFLKLVTIAGFPENPFELQLSWLLEHPLQKSKHNFRVFSHIKFLK